MSSSGQTIERVLRGGDVAKVKGIDQGSAYSPLALNVFLHHAHDVALAQDHAHPLWWRYADNLCYLTRSVPEALQILEKVRHRLGEARLSLKGEDGPPVDLHQRKMKLLGFTLSMQAQDVSLGLSGDAFVELKQHLEEAHNAVNPSATARTVVHGWVNACGPAFGKLTDGDTVAKVLRTAADCGFRETYSLKALTQTAGNAWKRWNACLEKAGQRRLKVAPATP